jgi:hypothetical protein
VSIGLDRTFLASNVGIHGSFGDRSDVRGNTLGPAAVPSA